MSDYDFIKEYGDTHDYDHIYEREHLNKVFGDEAFEEDEVLISYLGSNQETKRITTLSTKPRRKRERVRRIDQEFGMMQYGTIQNMAQKIKIPRVRNMYLREAFFKCYFQGPYYKEKNYASAFHIFTNLFYYTQEIREATRELFDTFTEVQLFKSGTDSSEYTDQYSNLMLYLKGLIFDGFKTLAKLPKPEDEIPPNEVLKDFERFTEFAAKKERVRITFRPKKSDYPDTNELFLELAGSESSDIIEDKGETYLLLFEKEYKPLNFIKISNQLWLQTFAFVVYQAVKEIEQEILQTGMLHAKSNVANIKQAISHFEQNYPDAKHMDKYQKAYFISHRYRKRSTGNKDLKRSSILKALKRANS